MINLQFFPSRQIAWYTVKLFLTRSLAVLVALVLVLMTLDLLGESGKILAIPGNGEADAAEECAQARLLKLAPGALPGTQVDV